MKKQAVKNLTIFIVLLALIAGAFSCGFFTNDVAYAAVLPDAVSNQWFDGEDYNNFGGTLQAINKIKDGLSTAEKADFKNNPVLVAVIDTGINASHELFDGVLCDEGLWYNALDKTTGSANNNVKDECKTNKGLIGHGTHVAGIVAQEIKKYGLEDYIKILPVKASNDGSFDASYVVEAINYVKDLATQDKTIVINMSLTKMIKSSDTSSWGKNKAIDVMIQSAVREGVIVCAAAGNNGYNSSSTGKSLGSPACLENVIGVMNYGEGLIPAPKSNYGAAYDIAAPGQKIISAAKSDETEPYCTKDGTSMATPFVSFAAAVLEIGFNRKSATVYDVMTSTPAVVTGTVSYGNGVYTAKKLNLSAFVDFKHIKEIKVFTEDESLDALNQNISSPKKVVAFAKLRYFDEEGFAPETDVAYKSIKMYVVKAGKNGTLSGGEVIYSLNGARIEFTPTEPGTYFIYAANSAYINDTSEIITVKVNYVQTVEDAQLSVVGDAVVRAESTAVYKLDNAYMLDPELVIVWDIYDENGRRVDTKIGTEISFTPETKGEYTIICSVGGKSIAGYNVAVKTSEKTVRAVSGGVTSAVAFSAVAAVLIIVIVKMLKRRA
ncbi:MAG: S8 family serine peptidase [Christensenellales bacterium]|nr:S8 family serine peptidase [Christensenellales bacterium]